ncbi:MAG: PKD domain-containing protein [Thermoplasmata archaeon]
MHRAALWALVVVLLGSTLATISAAPTPAATTFTLTGYVDQPGGVSAPPVPAGVSVELVSAATGTTYKTVTGAGGVFSFTTGTTSSALAPGYWKLVVPTLTNVSIGTGGKSAVLPLLENPAFAFYSYADLTNKNFATTISNVEVLPYNDTQNGTVHQGGQPVAGVAVNLLDPQFNGLVLSNTTTNLSGEFTMKLPWGHWVLQSIHVSGKNTFTNSTALTVASPTLPLVNPVLYGLTVSGWINTTAGRIPTLGNATLFDSTNGYIYSVATPAGGYYSLPTYLAGFTHGAQKFDVILAANGYGTVWYPLTVSTTTQIQKNVVVATMPESSMGVYTTDLNFTAIQPATGKGNLTVTTNVVLGNDSVVPGLPNATVGQLWAQLGLDYNHSITFPAADAAKFQAYLNSRGPSFLPAQAAATLNATPFVSFTTPQTLASFTTSCVGFCGLKSPADVSFGWNQTYALNGTLTKNSKSYSLGFSFQHPASSSLVYNYSVTLPTGYVLAAATTAPAHTTLTPTGPSKTWGQFTLSSEAWTTASASAKFIIVKAATVTPVVNVTSTNFTFSSANVLNDSEGNYTVVLGAGEVATFSAANSKYGTSTNGSLFTWDFGDGHSASTSNLTANHTYTVATPTTHFPTKGMYNGTLNVTTSGGQSNSTSFHVWVVTSSPTAVISSNATALEMKKTLGGTPYLEVNWSSTIAFNAGNSTVPNGNVKAIAAYSLVASKTVHKSANYTVASGGNVSANWTVDFSPPKTIGTAHYLQQGKVGSDYISFFGWEYNLTLTVWSGTGTMNSTSLAILVVDTQPPTPAFTILNSAGKAITGSSIQEGASRTAKVQLDAATALDPNNGTILSYDWHITNGNNTSLSLPNHGWANVSTVKPYPTFNLAPLTHPYTINLTVKDEAGNTANKTFSLTVSENSTLRPVMYATTLTGPTSLTDGKGATFWLNVTDKGGKKSTADNVTVTWYVQSASGTGSKRYITSPTTYFGYSKGAVNNVPLALVNGKVATLGWNTTIRAEVTWSPGFSGNFVLYANITATNEFKPDYHGGSNIAALTITIHANPTTQLLEYGGIAAAVIVAIGLLIWWTRRPGRKAGTSGRSTGRGGLERGSKKPETTDKENEA